MCTVFKSPDKVKTIGVLSFNYAAQRLFLNKMANAKYKDIRIANKYMWKNTHLWILHILHQLKMSPEEIMIMKNYGLLDAIFFIFLIALIILLKHLGY